MDPKRHRLPKVLWIIKKLKKYKKYKKIQKKTKKIFKKYKKIVKPGPKIVPADAGAEKNSRKEVKRVKKSIFLYFFVFF